MYVLTYDTPSLYKVMQFKQMFVTAVCVLFLLNLIKWPKSSNFYKTNT